MTLKKKLQTLLDVEKPVDMEIFEPKNYTTHSNHFHHPKKLS